MFLIIIIWLEKIRLLRQDWNERKLLDPVCVLETMYGNENDVELKKIICNRYVYQLGQADYFSV